MVAVHVTVRVVKDGAAHPFAHDRKGGLEEREEITYLIHVVRLVGAVGAVERRHASSRAYCRSDTDSYTINAGGKGEAPRQARVGVVHRGGARSPPLRSPQHRPSRP